MRKLGIDYGNTRTGIAITDALGITAQGLKTITHNGNDKILLAELDKILLDYDVDTIVIGIPMNMNGDSGIRVEETNRFIHKLRCKYNKIKIETVDERLTTVQAYNTMHDLGINKNKKKKIVDTLSATYILEVYINKSH